MNRMSMQRQKYCTDKNADTSGFHEKKPQTFRKILSINVIPELKARLQFSGNRNLR